MEPTHVLRKPLLTEKSTFALEQNRYAFEVDRRATKNDIKAAVEAVYKVTVEKVNTQVRGERTRRMKFGVVPGRIWKMAVVRLKDGDKIELIS